MLPQSPLHSIQPPTSHHQQYMNQALASPASALQQPAQVPLENQVGNVFYQTSDFMNQAPNFVNTTPMGPQLQPVQSTTLTPTLTIAPLTVNTPSSPSTNAVQLFLQQSPCLQVTPNASNGFGQQVVYPQIPIPLQSNMMALPQTTVAQSPLSFQAHPVSFLPNQMPSQPPLHSIQPPISHYQQYMNQALAAPASALQQPGQIPSANQVGNIFYQTSEAPNFVNTTPMGPQFQQMQSMTLPPTLTIAPLTVKTPSSPSTNAVHSFLQQSPSLQVTSNASNGFGQHVVYPQIPIPLQSPMMALPQTTVTQSSLSFQAHPVSLVPNKMPSQPPLHSI